MNLILLLLAPLWFSMRLVQSTPITRPSCTISTGGVSIKGVVTSSGACRYSVRYAYVAERWADSTIATDLRSVLLASYAIVTSLSDNVL